MQNKWFSGYTRDSVITSVEQWASNEFEGNWFYYEKRSMTGNKDSILCHDILLSITIRYFYYDNGKGARTEWLVWRNGRKEGGGGWMLKIVILLLFQIQCVRPTTRWHVHVKRKAMTLCCWLYKTTRTRRPQGCSRRQITPLTIFL